jgi:hypothetical protein
MQLGNDKSYTVLKKKDHLGRQRWEDNIKMHLRKIESKGVNRTQLVLRIRPKGRLL